MDELIEQLAERRFGARFGTFSYAELTEHGKEQYRAMVREDWPLIVAFVRDWLTCEVGSSVSEQWMDAMGTRDVMAAIRRIEEP